MEDSNLRLFVAVYAPSPNLKQEIEKWFNQKKVEMFKTGLFENVARKTIAQRGYSFNYGFILKDQRCLQDFEKKHLVHLVTDFQKKFPKTKHVEIITVLGQMEVLD